MRRVLVVATALSLSMLPVTTVRASFPGTNGKIAYEAPGQRLHRQIFVMQPDGSGVTLFASSIGDNFSPVWSPDGTKIAFGRSSFSRKKGRRGFLEVKNADGSGRTVIRRVDFLIDLAWSPNGTSLAFSTPTTAPGSIHIFTVHIDGTHLRDLTKNHGTQPHQDRAPTWSPDGTKIAFSTFGRNGGNLIETMSPNGSLRRVLVPNGRNDSPDWSPDGSKVVFQRDTNDNPVTDIFIVNADGTGLKRLTHTPTRYEWTPVFSPDGTKILYSRGRGFARSDDLWTMNLDGSSQARIMASKGISEFNADWQPT